MNLFSLCSLASKDFFRFEFFKYALFSSLVSFASMIALAFFALSKLENYLNSLLTDTNSWFSWLYSFSWIQFIINASSFLALIIFVIFSSIFVSLFILSFFVPQIADRINAKYYHFEYKNRVGDLLLFWEKFKFFLKFLPLFILASLLLLVPFVNIFAYFLVFYYLFHQMFVLDILGATLEKEKFKSIKATPTEFKLYTLIFYILSGFLIVGFAFQLLFILILIHLSYQKILFLSPDSSSLKLT